MTGIKQRAQLYMVDRPNQKGETIQFGWFIFRIVSEGNPPEIETLDMKRMASFTSDFTEADRIHGLQMNLLAYHSAEPDGCCLRQSAMVSKSYRPGAERAFMKHDNSAGGNDSGWYVGVMDDPIDMNDPMSFELRSLYELSIHDDRMFPFWLLPPGYIAYLDSGRSEHLDTPVTLT